MSMKDHSVRGGLFVGCPYFQPASAPQRNRKVQAFVLPGSADFRNLDFRHLDFRHLDLRHLKIIPVESEIQTHEV